MCGSFGCDHLFGVESFISKSFAVHAPGEYLFLKIFSVMNLN